MEEKTKTNLEEEAVASVPHRESFSLHAVFNCENNPGNILSANLLNSNLSDASKPQLKLFLDERLAKNTLYHGSGHVTSTKFSEDPIQLYYCLVDVNHSKCDQLEPDEAAKKKFIVCFITDAIHTLDLFKLDLDRYTVSLLDCLESNAASLTLTDWATNVLYYLQRCVNFLGDNLKNVIHAALLNIKISLTGGSQQMSNDLQKFVCVCGMSEVSTETTFVDVQADSKQTCVIDMSNGSSKCNWTESTWFCTEWAQALSCGDTGNPFYLKQVIDNYKLKAIQDMNTLKRLIQQAESDYYALYKCFVFLKNSGNATILMQHMNMEQQCCESSDNLTVNRALKNLNDYLLQQK